jgi:hypothetical protein
MKKFKQQIKRKEEKFSMGYRDTYIFNCGYVEALKTNKLITNQQYEKYMDQLTRICNYT